MNTIDGNAVQAAAEHVIHAVQRGVTVHTVTLTLNGNHGGADLRIEGHLHADDLDKPLTDFMGEHVIR